MMMIALALAFTPPSVRHVRTTTIAMAATPKSFEDALADAPTLCAALQAGEAPEGLGQFVASSAGARGFFVHYLTGDEWTCADKEEVPAALVSSLQAAKSPATVEIMLMNVVMSAATAVAHRRAGREEQATTSERTSARAGILVRTMWESLPELRDSFDALSEAVQSEFLVEAPPARVAVDEWVAFLARWSYDQEQTQIVADALAEIKGAAPKP